LREVRRAVRRGGLTEDGFAVAEGCHLLEEALRSGCQIGAILAAKSAKSAADSLVRGSRHRVTPVDDAAFQAISATETTQGVLALVRPPAWTMDQLFPARAMVVVLDGVQDPGNAGTIVRTAEAFGATGAIFLKGTASPHNPKTLRASAGSLFRLPYVAGIDAFDHNRVPVYAAQPRGSKPLAEIDLRGPFALVVGSEGRGVSAAIDAVAIGVAIPTKRVESLNAAMAAGIILYEASRQRGPR
jgi:TrmH family RNA methyltransferase